MLMIIGENKFVFTERKYYSLGFLFVFYEFHFQACKRSSVKYFQTYLLNFC